MGLVRFLLGGGAKALGGLIKSTAEVFRPNAEAGAQREYDYARAAQSQYTAEFVPQARRTYFDSFVSGLNRLPRPLMAFGTIGLFAYAMFDPIGFSARMVGLDAVPDELWWLLGVVVGFYFGAREMHKFRSEKRVDRVAQAERIAKTQSRIMNLRNALSLGQAKDESNAALLSISGDMRLRDNAALKAWQKADK